MTDEDIERHKRLQEFFKHDPIVDDLQEHIGQMMQNALSRLISPINESRDFSAGEASGIREVMELDNYFRDWVAPNESKT